MAKSDYLSPHWQKKRLEILERDGWTCVACGDKSNTLHVHHVLYCGKPWNTPSEYLQTLCEKCHAALGNHRLGGLGFVTIGYTDSDGQNEFVQLHYLFCTRCGSPDIKACDDGIGCDSCSHVNDDGSRYDAIPGYLGDKASKCNDFHKKYINEHPNG